jgi:hypothetical protein
MRRKVWYFQDGDYEGMCLLGCEVSDKHARKFREELSAYIVRVGKLVYLTYTEGGCSRFVSDINIYLPNYRSSHTQKKATLVTGNVSNLNYKENGATARQRHRSIIMY